MDDAVLVVRFGVNLVWKEWAVGIDSFKIRKLECRVVGKGNFFVLWTPLRV